MTQKIWMAALSHILTHPPVLAIVASVAHLRTPQINSLLEDAVTGRPLRGPAPAAAAGPSPLSPSTAHAIFAATVSDAVASTALKWASPAGSGL